LGGKGDHADLRESYITVGEERVAEGRKPIKNGKRFEHC